VTPFPVRHEERVIYGRTTSYAVRRAGKALRHLMNLVLIFPLRRFLLWAINDSSTSDPPA
jgi:hypothetical protein